MGFVVHVSQGKLCCCHASPVHVVMQCSWHMTRGGRHIRSQGGSRECFLKYFRSAVWTFSVYIYRERERASSVYEKGKSWTILDLCSNKRKGFIYEGPRALDLVVCNGGPADPA